MPQPDAATQALIRRLTAGTEKRLVTWQVSAPTMFFVDSASGRVTVWSGSDSGDHPYGVEVRNKEGMVVGSGETIYGPGYADWEVEIGLLFTAARASALAIGETFSGIAGDLQLPPDPADEDIPF
jgi:hypothetical protein